MKFVSLHNHSHFSLLDGYQTIPEMVSRAKELGATALSITDHGTMRGVVEFYKECKAQGIKPIIGCEFYFCPDITVRDRSMTHHLVLLAMNDVGYRNLKELDTIAYKEAHMFYKPRIDESDLRKHSDGIVCLSACMASIVNTPDGEEWFEKFYNIFGDRFFAEIQPLNIDKQQEYNEKVIGLARKYNVPLVVTTDAHYARPEDEPYHYLWLQIHGNGYHDNENYQWSEDELRKTPWIPDEVKDECIENTARIADMCDVEIEFGGQHYPVYTDRDPAEVVREICRANWKAKVPHGHYAEYAERFEAEMKDLEATNYLNYLLIIWDLVNWCVKNNIPVGEGRGSAAGCLVGYLMGFHKVDSIKFGTEFFRFCNPMRQSPADIDTDVSTNQRSRIIDYIKEHYGTVYKVTTYGYTKNPDKPDVGKQAVLRAEQALEKEEFLSLSDAAQAEVKRRKSNKLDTGLRWTHERVLAVTRQLKESLDEILTVPSDFTKEERERLLDVSKHFAGRLDKEGVHASAILVTPDAVEKYCPIEGCTSTNTSTGKREYIRVAAFEYHTLEAMGLLKLDILGLRTLDIIDDCLKMIDVPLSLESIPMDDVKTYQMYADGNTTGVFQMESPGMQKIARELHTNSFNDLAALVALYRPGPLDSGMMQQYVDGKNGTAEIHYPCKAMEEITKDTYGVIIYQEQAMKISMKMAGYNLGQADALRKVIGRKEFTKIKAAVADFVTACENNGYSHEVATEVAAQIEAAGRYIFNKCVSGREKIRRITRHKFVPTIEEMYNIRNDIEYAKATGHLNLYKRYKLNGYGYAYSMCADGKTRKNKIVDIRYSGKLPVYVLRTESGREVRCTMNHKIPTPNGTKLLAELAVGDSVFVDGGYDKKEKSYAFYKKKQPVNARKGHCGFTKRSDGESVKFDELRRFYRTYQSPCALCGKEYHKGDSFELHHVNHDREDNTYGNLQWLCNSCHKKVHYLDGRTKKDMKGRIVLTEKIASITYECDENCYDVEMEAPNHNFMVDSGIIICNSHAVSYAKLSYKTAYLKAHYPVQYMCALLNSRSDQKKLQPYIEECRRMKIRILPPSLKVGNLTWTVEGDALRVGLTYIKGVGEIPQLPSLDWDTVVSSYNKRVVENLIKAGAMDYTGKSRGWMIANLQSTKEVMERKAHCKERIKYYEEQAWSTTDEKKHRHAKDMRLKWYQKLGEVMFVENAEKRYDAIAGEMEVLSFSFHELPKVLIGTPKDIHEFTDKNGGLMARITFATDYGDISGIVFSSAWKKQKYHDRYRGWQRGISVEPGHRYEFMRNKGGVIVDAIEQEQARK